ncbi:hypothetical protein ICE98_03329 [Lactococcus lactis]|nr:hypothetical protein [Lactococcus lactis]
MAFNITSGPTATAQKVVLYGVEGIGKSTFASQFPNAGSLISRVQPQIWM